jgi:hypothetical protein
VNASAAPLSPLDATARGIPPGGEVEEVGDLGHLGAVSFV